VPSDEIYTRIRRSTILWKLLFSFGCVEGEEVGILSDIWELSYSFTFGVVRLPDGRGVFYPWGISRLVYLVPSDETYRRINRSIILWGLLFFVGGGFLGPVAIDLFVLRPKEFTWYIFFGEAAVCLLPMILMYIRWARKVTQSLPLFDSQVVSQALDPTTAPSYEESVKRNMVWHSTFKLYAIFIFSLAFAIVGTGSLIFEDPRDLRMWLCALFFGACTIAVPFAIRIKRKMPKPD
jgi:hypothetical protein